MPQLSCRNHVKWSSDKQIHYNISHSAIPINPMQHSQLHGEKDHDVSLVTDLISIDFKFSLIVILIVMLGTSIITIKAPLFYP